MLALGDILGDSDGLSLGLSLALGLSEGDSDALGLTLALALALADSAEGLNAAIVNELSDGATSVQSQDTASVSGYLLSKATPPPGLTPALYATWSSNTNPPLTVQLSPEPALPEKAVTKNSQVSDAFDFTKDLIDNYKATESVPIDDKHTAKLKEFIRKREID